MRGAAGWQGEVGQGKEGAHTRGCRSADGAQGEAHRLVEHRGEGGRMVTGDVQGGENVEWTREKMKTQIWQFARGGCMTASGTRGFLGFWQHQSGLGSWREKRAQGDVRLPTAGGEPGGREPGSLAGRGSGPRSQRTKAGNGKNGHQRGIYGGILATTGCLIIVPIDNKILLTATTTANNFVGNA